MKPFFSALLVCMFFSMSGFTVVNFPVKKETKVSRTVPAWPVTGTTASSVGVVSYAIYGSGNTPSYIYFYQGSTSYGNYYFSSVSGSSTLFEASGMNTLLRISYVRMGIYASQIGYSVDFYGISSFN
ncbi:hypothetical protein SAMN05428988_1285 [Chitinophaga sp. YR573]|uniref:hypothetical protein n=1 Tax=Chitinophaga sp. YR573 TaxID=1881040 RepID=UPI0008B13B42|nr:hypothetical protein [Chitinophaga sp. YR573]SEW01648.1 hypothetical protein SAMN05428988_1285 [Chitinophaga sp. YR573]